MKNISKVFSAKFKTDLMWNFFALFMMAVSGLLINIIIATNYSANVLGVFNQIYALYIVFAQLATVGITASIIRYISPNLSDIASIVVSALIVVIIFAFTISVLLFMYAEIIGAAFNSNAIIKNIYYIAPGIFFFSINKILLAVLNSLRWMRSYAIVQSCRYVMLIGFLLHLVFFENDDGTNLTLIFTYTEVLLFFFLVILLRNNILNINLSEIYCWIKRHISFGLRSFVGQIMLEMNTRVDVIMLGLFLSDKVVGVYSFVAMIAEGLIQILSVLSRNVTPVITELCHRGLKQKLELTIKRGKYLSYGGIFIIGILAILSFPFWIELISSEEFHGDSWVIFSILALGVMCTAGYLPFKNILTCAGMPGWHSSMIVILVVTNIILNLLFISFWQEIGAALATSCALIISIIYMKIVVNTKLDVRI